MALNARKCWIGLYNYSRVGASGLCPCLRDLRENIISHSTPVSDEGWRLRMALMGRKSLCVICTGDDWGPIFRQISGFMFSFHMLFQCHLLIIYISDPYYSLILVHMTYNG